MNFCEVLKAFREGKVCGRRTERVGDERIVLLFIGMGYNEQDDLGARWGAK